MNIVLNFLNIFKKQQPCRHEINFVEKKFSINNVPMVYFECKDCGFTDEGHVYADIEDWNDEVIKYINGVRVGYDSLELD